MYSIQIIWTPAMPYWAVFFADVCFVVYRFYMVRVNTSSIAALMMNFQTFRY